MRALLIAAAFIAPLVVAAAAEPTVVISFVERSRIVIVTPADNGKTIGLAANQCLDLKLQTQAGSTGYDWYMAHDSTPLMKLEARTLTSPANAMPGAPSEVDYVLCAVEKGEGVVKFAYYRPWEKNTPPAKTLTFTVKIAK